MVRLATHAGGYASTMEYVGPPNYAGRPVPKVVDVAELHGVGPPVRLQHGGPGTERRSRAACGNA